MERKEIWLLVKSTVLRSGKLDIKMYSIINFEIKVHINACLWYNISILGRQFGSKMTLILKIETNR